MRSAWLVLLIGLTALSGCIGEDSDTLPGDLNGAGPDPVAREDLPAAAQAIGETEPHGTPDRDDGPVEVEMGSDGRWVAKQVITIRNGFGNADSAALGADTGNGAIRVLGFDGGGYALEATLSARGETEAVARERLGEMQLLHEDSKSGRRIALDTQVVPGEQVCLLDLICPTTGQWSDKSASLVYAVPQRAAYDLDLDTSNGAVEVRSLGGPQVRASTSNGAIDVDGAWEQADASSSNGRITLDGRFGEASASSSNGRITATGQFGSAELSTSNGGIAASGAFGDLTASTSNGGIDLDAGPDGLGSHSWQLQTSNGRITGKVATGPAYGYDVQASTSNGRITLDLPDSHTVGEQSDTRQHARTNGFEDRTHRTAVTLQTSNSAITLTG